MSTSHPTSLQDLLGNLDRVRATARSLVRGAAAADDLVQDALVVALKEDRRLGGDPRAWTRTTLRNLSWNRARGEKARAWREGEASRPEAQPSASEGAARAELARDVSEAVLGLDEPYRTVILLRFFEDLPPRKIAAETGASVEAVKKQLTRGQRELQKRLESRYGDRGSWAVALLPLTGPSVLGAAKAVGTGVFLRIAGAALVLGLAGRWGAGLVGLDREVPAPVIAKEEAALTPPALEPGVESPVQGGPRESAAGELAESSLGPAAEEEDGEAVLDAAPEAVFRGRAVDIYGRPLAGLSIRWVNKGRREVKADGFMTLSESYPEWLWRRVSLETDTNGEFQIDRYPSAKSRDVSWSFPGSELAKVVSGSDPEGVEIFVMAPLVPIAGTVTDTESRPLAGITVTLDQSLDRIDGFPQELMFLSRAVYSTKTDAEGRFGWRAGDHPSSQLRASRPGKHSSELIQIPQGGTDSIAITMPAAAQAPQWSVHGIVRDEDGAPVPRSTVACGSHQAMTDDQGRFRISNRRGYPEGQRLVAQRSDFRFIAMEVPSRDAAYAAGGAGPLELRFPKQRPRLRGQLVDTTGEPLEGWEIYVMDGTFMPNTYVRYEHFRKGHRPEDPYVTGQRGIFTIDNLLDRPYDLRFVDPETLAFIDALELAPAAGPARVVFSPTVMGAGLRGRVVDVFGQPVSGARVSLGTAVTRGKDAMRAYDSVDIATTDESGEFSSEDARWTGQTMSVTPKDSPSGQSTEVVLTEDSVQLPIEVQVDLDCSVEIDGRGVPGADAVRFATDDGETLHVVEYRPSLRVGGTTSRRGASGSFYPLSVSQRATLMILLKDGREIDRQPLRLETGRTNRLSL